MFRVIGIMLQSLWHSLATVTMLVGLGTAGTHRRTAPRARMYLAALAITAGVALMVVPLLLILKVVSGWAVFAYLAAITALVFTLGLSLLWSPLGILIGMWQGHTINPITGGERYIRTVGVVLFTETMLAMFVLFVPFHHNLGMLPLFLLAAAAVALSSAIWGGYLGAGFYKLVATVVFLAVTVSFFLPQTFATIGAKAGTVDKQLAQAISEGDQPRSLRQLKIKIPIQRDQWSDDWIILPRHNHFGLYMPGQYLELQFNDGQPPIRVEKGRYTDLGERVRPFKMRGDPGATSQVIFVLS